MNLTVRAAFAELLHRIELNPTRVGLASQRYNAVKKTIEAALPGKTVRQVGSFQRKTKIRPIDFGDELDIDAVVSFGPAYKFAPPGENGITPIKALQIVRSALTSNEIYKVMEPTTDAPVVVLQYKDKFKIELAAAYIDKMGQRFHGPGGPDCYIVAGSDGSWLPADYDYDSVIISGLNQAPFIQNSLVPFIKIAKAYLRGMEVPLKSFHVEILVALTIPSTLLEWHKQQYTWGFNHILASFLGKAGALLWQPVSLPDSFSEPIDSNLSPLQAFYYHSWFEQKSQEAWRICKLSDECEAVEAWNCFFGSPFPGP